MTYTSMDETLNVSDTLAKVMKQQVAIRCARHLMQMSLLIEGITFQANSKQFKARMAMTQVCAPQGSQAKSVQTLTLTDTNRSRHRNSTDRDVC